MFDAARLRELAEQLVAGRLPVEDFLNRAAAMGIADVGEAQVDVDRARRCGFPEVVYGEGKTVEALEKILAALIAGGADAFATRVSAEKAEALLRRFPQARYNPVARTFRVPLVSPAEGRDIRGIVAVVTAGTSDLPVAEEAKETALWTGADVRFVQDVGVAGPHRLRANLHLLQDADAVVVVAGMEGALPSVVGGFTACPVIGVPSSVGYGANFGGVSALLSMLNSCAANVVVVNIDAGFKGGYVAGLIAKNAARRRQIERDGAAC
ncbi:MAG: nickel pincer cofactor biosynthesis protein LarB [Thermogutta sp.]|nr:nickel pincer cofactor biosynthesis protein LarB [Thermogutta sp.]